MLIMDKYEGETTPPTQKSLNTSALLSGEAEQYLTLGAHGSPLGKETLSDGG